MKISDEIMGAISALALCWSIGTLVKSQCIDKHDADGNLINPKFGNHFFVGSRNFLYNAWNADAPYVIATE